MSNKTDPVSQYGNALEEAEALARRIHKEFDPIELIINMTGPVLGIKPDRAPWRRADTQKPKSTN